ncbi:hypothetical protein [Burkholderia sp. Ac-20379]|uniref:hypothetical protein n=1 Tax=Burkholderia sp. Ac-20379 TaxID=2703900 RepID=UPI00197D509E|nr:hypothetical protein [Burkholderia sp. Ac-20379]MBN3723153.1 hypothetical protein [Burkholderia sp. Ac-20379]
MKKAAALVALACLTLSACGGGDDSSPVASGSSSSGSSASSGGGASSGAGGSSGTGSPGTGSSTFTSRFEALTPANDAASFLTQLNAEGAKGFRYVGDEFFSGDASSQHSIYVNDGSASTYTYELPVTQTTQSAYLAQMNAEGARGFRYDSDLTYGTLYRNDGSSATYSYQFQSNSASPADFLVQANAQGQSGYWFVGPYFIGGAFLNLYAKNGASGATYAYEAPAESASASDFVTQANAEGARGFRAKGTQVFGSSSATVYVKDQTQSPTFTYQAVTQQLTSAGFVTQSNTLGAQGNAYFSDMAFGASTASIVSVYFVPKNCTGFLCTTLNPLIQN